MNQMLLIQIKFEENMVGELNKYVQFGIPQGFTGVDDTAFPLAFCSTLLRKKWRKKFQ